MRGNWQAVIGQVLDLPRRRFLQQRPLRRLHVIIWVIIQDMDLGPWHLGIVRNSLFELAKLRMLWISKKLLAWVDSNLWQIFLNDWKVWISFFDSSNRSVIERSGLMISVKYRLWCIDEFIVSSKSTLLVYFSFLISSFAYTEKFIQTPTQKNLFKHLYLTWLVIRAWTARTQD